MGSNREIYLEGEKEGKRQVKKHLTAIYTATTTEDLGRIAGAALDDLTAQETYIVKHTFAKTANWRMGFIDGFLDTAAEFKAQQ